MSICSLLLFSRCEGDIQYTFENSSFSSAEFTLCEYNQCPDLSLKYVVFSTPKESAAVINADLEKLLIEQLIFKGQTAPSIKEAVESYLSNAQNAYPETSDFSSTHEFTMDITVRYNSNAILSLQNSYYEFAGGAHGSGGLIFWNYNSKTGQRLENISLFKDVGTFSAFAKAKFIAAHGPLNQFWFKNETFALPESIGFSEEGLLLFYNVYEIASYAAGTFELILPWEEIEDYLSF